MAEGYVSNPTGLVSMHQHIQVKILEVDISKKRIQLSMRLGENQN